MYPKEDIVVLPDSSNSWGQGVALEALPPRGYWLAMDEQ